MSYMLVEWYDRREPRGSRREPVAASRSRFSLSRNANSKLCGFLREMDCEIDCNNDSERKVFTTISSPHETSTIQYALLQHALTRL